MKKVICGDTMKCLERFAPKETSSILKRYRNDGRWEDVGVDIDGDIILWEE